MPVWKAEWPTNVFKCFPQQKVYREINLMRSNLWIWVLHRPMISPYSSTMDLCRLWQLSIWCLQLQIHPSLTDLQKQRWALQIFSFFLLYHVKLCPWKALARHCRRKRFFFLVLLCFFGQAPIAQRSSLAPVFYTEGPFSWTCNLCRNPRPYAWFVLCCCHLEIFNTFWTRGSTFSFWTRPCKLYSQSCLHLRVTSSTRLVQHPVPAGHCGQQHPVSDNFLQHPQMQFNSRSLPVKSLLSTLDMKCFLVPFCYDLLLGWGYWILPQRWAWQTRWQAPGGGDGVELIWPKDPEDCNGHQAVLERRGKRANGRTKKRSRKNALGIMSS